MSSSSENARRPFPFWLLEDFSSGDSFAEEELRPINDREFYTWMGLLFTAILIYGFVFHFIA